MPLKGLTVYGRSEQLATTGAQLLNPELFDKDTTMNGITFAKQPDGSIKVSGRITATATFFLGEYVDILEDGQTYFFNSDSPHGVLKIKYNDGAVDDYVTTITIDKSRTVSVTPYIQFSTNKPNTKQFVYPMLNNGSNGKTFEPYTGGKPSPSIEYPQDITNAGDSGEINVNVLGKNLADVSKVTDVTGADVFEKYKMDIF